MRSHNFKKIDWKMVAGIDLNTFKAEIAEDRWPVEEIAADIAYCSVEDEFDVRRIDQNLLKLFKLSQVLLSHFTEDWKRLKQVEKEHQRSASLVNENAKLRKLLNIHQQSFSFTGSEMPPSYIQCPHCPKAFYEPRFLQNHIVRRHPESGLESEGPLSLSRKIGEYARSLSGDTKALEEVKNELVNVKQKLEITEILLTKEKEERQKLEDRIEIEISDKVKELQENLKENEQLKSDQVLSQLRSDFQNQLLQANLKEMLHESESEDDIKDDSKSRKMQKFMMQQTHEVQKIGASIEKLVKALTTQKTVSSVNPAQATRRRTKAKAKNHAESPKATQAMEILMEHLEEDLNEMRIKSGMHVSRKQFKQAMALIEDSRKHWSIKEMDIKRTIEAALDSKVKRSPEHKTQSPLVKLITVPVPVPRPRIIKLDQKIQTSGRTFVEEHIDNGSKDITNIDEPSLKPEPVVVEVVSAPPVKSVLVRRDDSKPKGKKQVKKLRFNDERIEISPESSDNDDSFTEQIQVAKTEINEETHTEGTNELDSTDEPTMDSNIAKEKESAEPKSRVQELTKTIEEQLSRRSASSFKSSVDTVNNKNRKKQPTVGQFSATVEMYSDSD